MAAQSNYKPTKRDMRATPLSDVSRTTFLLLALVMCILAIGCTKRFSYTVDRSIAPRVTELPGLDGGLPRSVSAIVDAKGRRSEFVQNEVTIHTKDKTQLDALLTKYHGTILRDGTPPVIEGLQQRGEPTSSGDYLIRVDLSMSSPDDIIPNMRKAGVGGSFMFSSDDAVRLAALVARERSLRVGPNFMMQPRQVITEGANPLGTDAALWPWMAGASGLGIGVVQAWNYLLYKGVPPTNGTFHPAVVAIIDNGFDLDSNGKPNNADYRFLGAKPLQFDLINRSASAGGIGSSASPWHGQQVFSIAAAMPRNGFGIAGTGGEAVFPLLIKIDLSAAMAGDAVRAAAFNRASVANMSFGGECSNAFCRAFDFSWVDNLQSSINLADSFGTITVAAAGNNNQPANDQFDDVPCTLNNVVCVGAIQPIAPATSEPTSGSGKRVAIWAPDCTLSTPIPPNPTQLPTFCGTSAATSFVSGIVGMMKVLQPTLHATQVIEVLRTTALPSTDPRVSPGYVNALRAVQAVNTNQSPTIQIVEPTATQASWGNTHFASHINDPEQPGSLNGVSIGWTSDRDGFLCAGFDCNGTLSTIGRHTITATVRDLFGATGESSITIDVIGVPPTVTIFNPTTGSTFPANAPINLIGFATSPSQLFNDADLKWFSSISGGISAGRSVVAKLPSGTHTITLSVADQKGVVGTSNIAIEVVEGLDIPSIQILSPIAPPFNNNVATFDNDAVIQFKAHVTDPVDGILSGNSIVWTSSLQGQIGTGAVFSVKLIGGSCGHALHIITVKATNAGGRSTEQKIQVSVGRIC
jgi:hypothetical protein